MLACGIPTTKKTFTLVTLIRAELKRAEPDWGDYDLRDTNSLGTAHEVLGQAQPHGAAWVIGVPRFRPPV